MTKADIVNEIAAKTGVAKRDAMTARNISKNTTIVIPAHDFPAFKPAKSFVAKMKGEEVADEDDE